MTRAVGNSYVVECFWSGVRDEDLRELDRRIEDSVADFAKQGQPVEYLGSMLVVDDDVVLCLFEGPLATVRQVTERAGIAFERILQSTRAPWTARSRPTGE